MLSKDEIIERLDDVFRDVLMMILWRWTRTPRLMISRIGTLSSISLLSVRWRTSSR